MGDLSGDRSCILLLTYGLGPAESRARSAKACAAAATTALVLGRVGEALLLVGLRGSGGGARSGSELSHLNFFISFDFFGDRNLRFGEEANMLAHVVRSAQQSLNEYFSGKYQHTLEHVSCPAQRRNACASGQGCSIDHGTRPFRRKASRIVAIEGTARDVWSMWMRGMRRPQFRQASQS